MQIYRTSILNALNDIGFTPEEKAALRLSLSAVESDPSSAARFVSDCAGLAREDGPDALEPRPDPLYPALVLLAQYDRVRGEYDRLGIGEDIFRDTLSDIPLWIRHCERVYGFFGIKEYSWLTGYTRMHLFRLGRLEFMCGNSEVPAVILRDPDGGLRACGSPQKDAAVILAPGDPVIEVHIPEGPPLEEAAVSRALAAAPGFFAAKFGRRDLRAFVCRSWLMSPCFAEILPGSNSDRFQARFFKVSFGGSDAQMFERLYDVPKDQARRGFEGLPMDTRLRRAMRDYYERGGSCPQMDGVIPIEPIDGIEGGDR